MSKAGTAPWIAALVAGVCVCGCHDSGAGSTPKATSPPRSPSVDLASPDAVLRRLKASALPLTRPLVLHPAGRCRMEATGPDPVKLRSHPILSAAPPPPGTGAALRELWNDPDPTFHGVAALALACWEPNAPDVRSKLRMFLEQTNSPALRLYALNAYPLLGPVAVEDLTRALESPHADVRLHAAFGLGLIGGGASNAVPAIILRLQPPGASTPGAHQHEAAAAAFALRRLGIPAWAPVLSVVAKASEGSARAAAEGLRFPADPREAALFSAAVASAISGATSDGRAVMAELLGEASGAGGSVRSVLEPFLQDPSPQVRLWACVSWIRTQPDSQRGASGFEEAFQAVSDDTRIRALEAFAQFPIRASAGLIPAITEQLGAETPQIRAAAARALGNLNQRPTESLPALMRLLGDGHPDAKEAAVWAVGRYGVAALAALTAQLNDPSPSLREGAARALGRLRGIEGAVSALTGVIQGQPTAVRRAIISSLESLAERPIDTQGLKGASIVRSSLPVLVNALGDEDAEVRRSAVGALARIGPDARSAAAPLLARLRDGVGSVRRAAALALEDIGYRTAESVPILMEILNDPASSDATKDRANRLLLEVDPEANRVRNLATP